jgi:hypothetical protein
LKEEKNRGGRGKDRGVGRWGKKKIWEEAGEEVAEAGDWNREEAEVVYLWKSGHGSNSEETIGLNRIY